MAIHFRDHICSIILGKWYDRFLARYSPPQPENIRFRVKADGQLSLIDFEVQPQPEPPDLDDFEFLEEFREAIALWDSEHNEVSSEHCSDQNEPPDPYEFDSMFGFWAAYDAWVSEDDSEPNPIDKLPNPIDKLISLDSFCLWAHCPDEWYKPIALLEPSKVLELSPVPKSSITWDFLIPTFDAWCDRPDRSDEPPDTGIFARLPKPKSPQFPPQVSPSQPQVNQASRNYPETISSPRRWQ